MRTFVAVSAADLPATGLVAPVIASADSLPGEINSNVGNAVHV